MNFIYTENPPKKDFLPTPTTDTDHHQLITTIHHSPFQLLLQHHSNHNQTISISDKIAIGNWQ